MKLLWKIGLLASLAFTSCQTPSGGLSLARFENRLDSSEGNVEDISLKIRGFHNAELAESKTGIFLEEKFDPDKTPILLVHGLISEPDTWTTMVDTLKRDPKFTDNYQFWYYAYPSGTPTIPSAAILRMHLDATIERIESDYQISMERRLIVVGHSMGGILAKSLVSSSGDKLLKAAFTSPIDDFDLTDKQRQLLSNAFKFEPRSYVSKTIFLAAPHRGSPLAEGISGKIGTALSARPAAVESLSDALLARNREHLTPKFSEFLNGKANSISTLQPGSPVTIILAELSIDPGVEFHSISGIKNKRTRKGDGVVPIGSTEVPGAYCEVGVYSDHNVHKNAEAIELVKLFITENLETADDEDVLHRLSDANLAFTRFKGRLQK